MISITPKFTSDAEKIERLTEALAEIAIGRQTCGAPLGGNTAREIARGALLDIGSEWKKEASHG